MLCALHGHVFTHGCPGCETAEDWQIVGLVAERDRNDTGERISLDELIEDLGFDREELEAEIDTEDA